MVSDRKLVIYTDGSSHSNPGPAGAGVVIMDEKGKVIRELSKYLGEMTNNSAEYMAFILALEEARRLNASDIIIKLDSELVVRQLRGEYKVRDADLFSLYSEAKSLMRNFKSVEIKSVQREENKHADRLANKSVKEMIKSRPDGYTPDISA